MTTIRLRRFGTIAALGCATLAATGASAHHAWSTYAWNFDGTAVNVAVVDNTSAQWRSYVQEAVGDWNASEVIEAPLEYGNNSSCAMTTNTIQVWPASCCRVLSATAAASTAIRTATPT